MTAEQKKSAKWLAVLTAIGAVAAVLQPLAPVAIPMLKWLWLNAEIIFILYPVKHTMYGVICGALSGASYPWVLLAALSVCDATRRVLRRPRYRPPADPAVTLARSRVVAAAVTMLVVCLFEPNREGFVFGFMSALSGTQFAMMLIRRLAASPNVPTPSNLELPFPPPPANYENLRR